MGSSQKRAFIILKNLTVYAILSSKPPFNQKTQHWKAKTKLENRQPGVMHVAFIVYLNCHLARCYVCYNVEQGTFRCVHACGQLSPGADSLLESNFSITS
jgi:hypothetical protein